MILSRIAKAAIDFLDLEMILVNLGDQIMFSSIIHIMFCLWERTKRAKKDVANE